MNKSRWSIILAVGLVAVLAVVVALFVLKPKGGEEEEAAADMAVHTGTISRATLHQIVTAYGTVMPQPAGQGQVPADSDVASPVAGVVARIDCVEGQRVTKGTALFRLDSRAAEVAVDKAKKALVFAEADFARQKELLPVEGTSPKAYQQAELQLNAARSDLAAAETDLALLRITAPLDGTVVKINAQPGEAVELNTVLATIIDLDRLVVEAAVPSRESGALRVGQAVRFEGEGGGPAAGPAGRVIYVGAEIDPKTDTVPVRVSVAAANGFRPGRFLMLRIVSGEHKDCLAVPEKAVVADTVAADSGVIVLVEGDQAVRKPVRIGFREGGLVEVEAEGLKEGQVIVTDDAYAVPAEPTKIHIVK